MNYVSFDPFPELETDRLLLRALETTDNKAIFRLRTNVQVNRYIMREREKTQKEIDGFVLRIRNGIAENKWIYWVITKRDSGTFVGTICLWNFAFDAPEAELGYELLPVHQGKGLMQEALQAVVRFGFDTLKLQQISAYTNKANERSIRLLERNQFQYIPERKDGNFADNLIYALKNATAAHPQTENA